MIRVSVCNARAHSEFCVFLQRSAKRRDRHYRDVPVFFRASDCKWGGWKAHGFYIPENSLKYCLDRIILGMFKQRIFYLESI